MSDPAGPPPGAGSGPAWGGAPTGELILDLRGARLELNEPRLLIDGYPAPAHWGENRIRVPAGRRQIAVSVEPAMNLFQLALGPASTAVAVAPGQQVQLFYSMPRFARMAGAIGTVPQPRPGQGLFLLLCIGPGALALIVVGFVLVRLHYF